MLYFSKLRIFFVLLISLFFILYASSNLFKTSNKLLNKKITVATAESCSGGLLSYNFIKHRDTSKIFKFGIICYSNESKIKQLNINLPNITVLLFDSINSEIVYFGADDGIYVTKDFFKSLNIVIIKIFHH